MQLTPREKDKLLVSMAAMVARRDIPIALPLALIEGFEWDAAQRRCETLSDTCAYGVRVAGSVGVMMTLLMGVRSAQALARADALARARTKVCTAGVVLPAPLLSSIQSASCARFAWRNICQATSIRSTRISQNGS